MPDVQLNEPTTAETPRAAGDIAPPVYLRVRTRTAWADDWTTADYLTALSVQLAVAPYISRAELLYHAGDVLREDASAFAQADPLSLRDTFVQIQRLPEPDPDADSGDAVHDDGTGEGGEDAAPDPVTLFTGVITDESFEASDTGTSGAAAGDLHVTAYGLELLLDRRPIHYSYATSDGGAQSAWIHRSLVFNERYRRGLSGQQNQGNRSTTRFENPWGDQDNTCYIFGDDDNLWTAKDVAEYLVIMYQVGTHAQGGIPFKLSGQVDALDGLIPGSLNIEGLTVRQALNRVIDPKRGLGWTVRIEEDADENTIVGIHVYSALDEAVTVSDATMPPNAEQARIELDGRLDLDNVVQTIDTSAQYDVIGVFGEMIRVMFTVSYADGTLADGWTAIEALSYRVGAGSDAAANDRFRARDALGHVFTRFVVPRDWGWLAGNGAGGPTTHNVNITCLDDGSVSLEVPPNGHIRDWGHSPLRSLLLVDEADAAGGEPEFAKPIVLFQAPDGTYHNADRPTDDALPSFHVRMLDNDLGFQLIGRVNHLLALNHWSGAFETNHTPQIDHETVVATIAVETDMRLTVMVAQDPPLATGERPGRILVLTVPDAHLWYVAPGAVSGTTGSALQYATEGVVRNDIERLKQIAALAKVWYGKPRRAVRLSLRDVTDAYPPGSLITAVSTGWQHQEIGAVVHRKTYDLRAMTTDIETGFIDLDVTT